MIEAAGQAQVNLPAVHGKTRVVRVRIIPDCPGIPEFYQQGAKMGVKELLVLARVPSILLLGLAYVAYVLIGGVVFWKLEGDLGERDIGLLLRNKKNLLTTYPCLTQRGLEEVAQVRPASKQVNLYLYSTSSGI